ncbi:MAG: queuosine precursor transporter [Bacteroidales bacterium]|nr:queuosine precursor transporter [Bacteroidales bacterium]
MDKVSGNPLKNRTNGEMPFMVVTALFVTLYLVSNIMAVKVISFFNIIYFDAGTITFPFAYMLGDILTEIWGYHKAKKVIWITFLCNIIMMFFTQVAVWLPSPDYLDGTAIAYDNVFTYVPRIVVASLTGFILGELSNSWLMDKIKKKTEGRFLWLRTIGSSIAAHLLDTVPFVMIAFIGTMTTRDIVMMIITQYFMKLGIEVVFGTPLAYAGVNYIKKRIKG